MSDPIAFVVMPFDVKPTNRTEPDVPTSVDFDKLWSEVYGPVLTELGYTAVRADRDVGAMIIREMIQRLALADLVVADITLPNANVYYEVGVRHAAKQYGCVLVGADWAQPVFDLRQMRQLRFPLADGKVGALCAARACDVLRRRLEGLVDGVSPVFDAVPGHPGPPNLKDVSAFQRAVAALGEFETDVRKIRASPRRDRAALVHKLVSDHGRRRVVRESVVLELIRLVRDNLEWSDVLDYVAGLPPHLARHPLVIEQRALALSKAGDPAGAVAQLETLIEQDGPTPERLGLLGGRYKVLWQQAADPPDKRRYLNKAIESYERGMCQDLNNYYPSSNLARLYRARNAAGDEQLASEAEVATALACRAAIEHGTADEWVRPTLLGNAFDRGDAVEASRLRQVIEEDGPDAWKLASTLADLRASVDHHRAADTRSALAAVLGELERLLSPSASGSTT